MSTPDRTVVAISEDRQWLVVLDPYFGRFRLFRDDKGDYIRRSLYIGDHPYLRDTGQSADEVLRKWMEGRNA